MREKRTVWCCGHVSKWVKVFLARKAEATTKMFELLGLDSRTYCAYLSQRWGERMHSETETGLTWVKALPLVLTEKRTPG